MVGSIKVHHHKNSLKIISGSQCSGKTSLLLGMAAMAKSKGKRILWLSTDYIPRHIAVHVEDAMIIHDADTLESLLKGPVAPLYDMIMFDDFDGLHNRSGFYTSDSIKLFAEEGRPVEQQRICTLTVRGM